MGWSVSTSGSGVGWGHLGVAGQGRSRDVFGGRVERNYLMQLMALCSAFAGIWLSCSGEGGGGTYRVRVRLRIWALKMSTGGIFLRAHGHSESSTVVNFLFGCRNARGSGSGTHVTLERTSHSHPG